MSSIQQTTYTPIPYATSFITGLIPCLIIIDFSNNFYLFGFNSNTKLITTPSIVSGIVLLPSVVSSSGFTFSAPGFPGNTNFTMSPHTSGFLLGNYIYTHTWGNGGTYSIYQNICRYDISNNTWFTNGNAGSGTSGTAIVNCFNNINDPSNVYAVFVDGSVRSTPISLTGSWTTVGNPPSGTVITYQINVASGNLGFGTFDNNNNIYVTYATSMSGVGGNTVTGNGCVYKLNSGSSTPTVIINATGKIYSNIIYNNIYDFLFILNNTSHTIDVYNTNGNLIISSYVTLNNSSGYNAGQIGGGSIGMAFDSYNNFYYGANTNPALYVRYYKYICFKKDSKILTLQGYKLIQELKEGDLVKTHAHGYKPIYKIGYKEMIQSTSEERNTNKLYKCSTENFSELFEDLVITGCHSILVDEFKDNEERDKSIEIHEGKLCMTDDKYRVPACVDKRTTIYDKLGLYTVYHFALENDDYYENYGVFANGLLVESTSKRFMDTNSLCCSSVKTTESN